MAVAACARRGAALVPSLISPVLSPPAGFLANASPQGRRTPAPAQCVCLSHCFQGCKGCPHKPRHGLRAGQRDVDKKEPQLGNTSGVLGFPCVRFWQSPRRGHACVVSHTFHHPRAVQVREVRHPARRPRLLGDLRKPRQNTVRRKTGGKPWILSANIDQLSTTYPAQITGGCQVLTCLSFFSAWKYRLINSPWE